MTRRKVLVTCLALLTLLSAAAACAQDVYKFRIPTYDEPFYGTWINTKYDGASWKTAQMFVYSNWGYAEGFKKVGDANPFSKFTFILVEKWTDAKGNTWYRELEQATGAKNYLLCRISKDGRTLEQIYRSTGFPAENDLGPAYPNYWIFYRK
jgi:hypothetical protein